MKRAPGDLREVYERFLAHSFQEKVHMSTELLHHVFGSLNGLEKCASESRNSLKALPTTDAMLAHDLTEGERVVGEMRKVANKLQIDLARKDWKNIVRTLHIFYGMLSMARPAILKSHAQLLSNNVAPAAPVTKRAMH